MDKNGKSVRSELQKLLFRKDILNILLDYRHLIAVAIPQLKPCIGFEQNNRYHCYDVYEHIAHAVANYEGDDFVTKMALLLHDVGKPLCYTEDDRGGHFYGHGEVSAVLAKYALEKLPFTKDDIAAIVELVEHHNAVIEPTAKTVRKWLRKLGKVQMRRLMDMRLADIRAHAEDVQQYGLERHKAVCELLDEAIAEQKRFKVTDLAIDGTDVMALGVPQGRLVGELLRLAYDRVVEGKVPNTRNELLKVVKTAFYREMTYTGSADSEEIARLIEGFKFDKDKREFVLAKYEKTNDE